MTVVANIHIGLPAWAASTAYAVGKRVSNGGNAYEATVAGTSAGSGGPSGTGTSITDNTVTWKWLSAIDYTSPNSWVASIPATLADAYEGRLWKPDPFTGGGEVTISAGSDASAWCYINGKTTTTTFTITLRAAPGESFSDNPAGAGALCYNPSAGFAVRNTATGGYTMLIAVTVANVILQGLQLKANGNNAYSAAVYLALGSGNGPVLEKMLVDSIGGSAVTGGMIHSENFGGAGFKLRNCVLIDRQASGGTGRALKITEDATAANAYAINCTFVAVNSPASGIAITAPSGTFTAINCVFMGHGVPFSANTAPTANSNVFSAASSTGSGTNNLFSKVAANQFVHRYGDFRLKSGNDCGSGVVDTTRLPSADDIFGVARS